MELCRSSPPPIPAGEMLGSTFNWLPPPPPIAFDSSELKYYCPPLVFLPNYHYFCFYFFDNNHVLILYPITFNINFFFFFLSAWIVHLKNATMNSDFGSLSQFDLLWQWNILWTFIWTCFSISAFKEKV